MIVPTKLDKDTQKSVNHLTRFIKRCPKILHIDISYCGLTPLILREFGTALRRSKNLRAIHLTGNQITPDVVKYLIERTHAKVSEKINMMPLADMPSSLKSRGL